MYLLMNSRGKTLSKHPSISGAQLSSLFHIKNGETVKWADEEGTVADKIRFRIKQENENG